MSALSNAAENSILLLLFNNTDFATIGDATGVRGSTTAGSLYASLHTADPESGTQSTSEISYTGYARVAVARSGAGFTVTADTVVNAAQILFGAMTAGAGGTATYVGIGAASSGGGVLLAKALITSPAAGLAISAGITPSIAASALTFTAA